MTGSSHILLASKPVFSTLRICHPVVIVSRAALLVTFDCENFELPGVTRQVGKS